MVLLAPHRHDKRLDAIVFALNNESGKDDSMCALDSQVSRPEFRRFKRRGMHNELVGVEVQCRCRLHAGDIRAVA